MWHGVAREAPGGGPPGSGIVCDGYDLVVQRARSPAHQRILRQHPPRFGHAKNGAPDRCGCCVGCPGGRQGTRVEALRGGGGAAKGGDQLCGGKTVTRTGWLVQDT